MKDRALIYVTDYQDTSVEKRMGRILACQGTPVNEHFSCKFDVEREVSDYLSDLGIENDFKDISPPALAVWEGEIVYCSQEWHGEYRCDCGPEMHCDEVRLATLEDIRSFGINVGG